MNKQTYGGAPFSTEGGERPGLSAGKQILVFGAGKSATCLIDYLIKVAGINNWIVTVADNDLLLAQSKTGNYRHAHAVSINAENVTERNQLIKKADIVISLLPPALHFLVAQDCVLFEKNLLTASYTDDKIRSLQPAINDKKLFFLCEMGLDPGIDHMSAMHLIHRIKDDGGIITSFLSHCGGLVAPESDDNPWHYKISWNPRNVVMAGKEGAVYRQDKKTQKMGYGKLFNENRFTGIPGIGSLAWYPNRDSLDYIHLYQLDGVETFIRTTLRHPQYCYGWRQVIDLQLTSETSLYDTGGMTLQEFFKQHFERHGFINDINKKEQQPDVFIKQLHWLGLHDNTTLINKGSCSAMDVLQFALEKKLVLNAGDKDMIVMLHEIEYLKGGKKYRVKSNLTVKGDDNLRTAMAKTVGLPPGIAAKLILQGKIKETGLHIPVIPSIYEPVLQELQIHGIAFHENTMAV
ncbi:MAG: saccharopine dehydrogenase C-terminal domain-containing protein [Chitinophagaceae bacterium]